MKWRVIKHDNEILKYEQVATVDTKKKPLSIDDVDRSEIAQLQTLSKEGKVLHTVKFEKGTTKKAVWRRTSGITMDGRYRQLFCLSGYVNKGELFLDRIFPDGKIESAKGEVLALHNKEKE